MGEQDDDKPLNTAHGCNCQMFRLDCGHVERMIICLMKRQICSSVFSNEALRVRAWQNQASSCQQDSVEVVSKRRLKGSETQAIRGPASPCCADTHACEVGRCRVQSSRAEDLARGRRARTRAACPAESKRFPAFRQLLLQGSAQSLGESRMLHSMGPNCLEERKKNVLGPRQPAANVCCAKSKRIVFCAAWR